MIRSFSIALAVFLLAFASACGGGGMGSPGGGGDGGGGASATATIGKTVSGFPGSLLTIDARTNVASGPSETPVTPSARMTISLDGYAVAFLTLKP